MFNTDLANEYVRCATEMRLTPAELKECALNGIRASWLDDGRKRDLLASWSKEIDVLTAQITPSPAAN
jgi:adenosine deaminase